MRKKWLLPNFRHDHNICPEGAKHWTSTMVNYKVQGPQNLKAAAFKASDEGFF